MAPVIGISMGLDDRGRWRAGREYQYADAAYAAAVAECGGVPLHIPLQPEPARCIERIDALLLPGGDDFPPPQPYPPEVRFEVAPPRQVELDRRLLEHALGRGLPVLAVCYGMQLLALHLGGTLHYHLPADRPDTGPHQLPEAERHPLRVEPGTRLARILGPAPDPVNSRHHQAVATPGSRLRVCARAGDGVIEAVETTDPRFCLGVQWHPEALGAAHRRALFGALVEAAAADR